MKYNAINLVRNGAEALIRRGDTGTAYALHELANNLLLLMEGKVTLEEWGGCYVATGCKTLDLDKHMPASEDEPLSDEDDEEDDWTGSNLMGG